MNCAYCDEEAVTCEDEDPCGDARCTGCLLTGYREAVDSLRSECSERWEWNCVNTIYLGAGMPLEYVKWE